MRRIDWPSLSASERIAALARPAQRSAGAIVETVARIFRDVERDGFEAVRQWALSIDKHEPKCIALDAKTVAAARARIEAADLAAIEFAIANVSEFHKKTAPADIQVMLNPGVACDRVWRAIPSCGLYAPGGSAPLISTLIMLAAPARVAGVPQITAMTPPARDGEALPIMIAAAGACGLEALWLLGGAQAIAAMTHGAGPPKADKIFGPGNAYVAEAKRYAAALPGGPQIDTPAGPSELLVIADDGARADLVAADLLSQAEHDSDAQVILVTNAPETAAAVEAQVRAQLETLPRADIARRSLAQGRCVLVRDLNEAAEVSNLYAPEHLSLQVRDAERLCGALTNAGAVFVGAWSAETFGDYVCGPSHVLPTDGAARAWSGVNTASFMKAFTFQNVDQRGARAMAESAARLARLEGLEAHARAADLRAQ